MKVKEAEAGSDHSGTVIPDYRKPDAIMVPHYPCEITSLLEGIAGQISRSCGVILLSSDKKFSQAFIETQKNASHFSIVTATFDSPWIRDRSPVAIKTVDGIRWCTPRMEKMDRPNDDQLFSSICSKQHQLSPIEFLAQGNMVVGGRGLVFVSNDVLRQNNFTRSDLDACKRMLGMHHWLTFSGFRQEMTGHADVHVRVLKAGLIAIAWNLSSKQDRQKTLQLIKKIKHYDDSIDIIKIPIRSVGKKYASLLNWIQIGKRLILPRFQLTTKDDIAHTSKILTQYGFTVEYIYSPTLEYGGSLHCLTASIHM